VLDDVLVACGRLGEDQLPGADAGPDIVCLGKALGSGVPASAMLARRDVAEAAWGDIEGEAIHTSTMVGEPLARAAVLRTLEPLGERDLTGPAAAWSQVLHEVADEVGLELRGRGLLWALDTGTPGAGFELSQRLLASGVLVVPSGATGSSITLYPSAVHREGERARLAAAVELLGGPDRR
jgi:acetylornithine/succinyldiaminopimelate/putrescine aminotransferase